LILLLVRGITTGGDLIIINSA